MDIFNPKSSDYRKLLTLLYLNSNNLIAKAVEDKDKSDKLREIAKQKLLCPYCLKLLYIGKFRARTLETKVT